MDAATALYKPSGRTPLAVFYGFLASLFLVQTLMSAFGQDWGIAGVNAVLFALFAAAATWVSRRRRATGLFLSTSHLISRDGSGEDTRIAIDDAVVEVTEVSGGTQVAPMTRTLRLPDHDGVPSQKVLVVRHGGAITELFQVRGMTPPKLRALRDDINANLDAARAAAGLPPVTPGYDF